MERACPMGMGPLGEIHWKGRWIGWDAAFAWDREDSHSRLSSRYLRTEFKTQAKEIKYATLHLCGLGMYELFINGQRIGDQVLAPAQVIIVVLCFTILLMSPNRLPEEMPTMPSE